MTQPTSMRLVAQLAAPGTRREPMPPRSPTSLIAQPGQAQAVTVPPTKREVTVAAVRPILKTARLRLRLTALNSKLKHVTTQ